MTRAGRFVAQDGDEHVAAAPLPPEPPIVFDEELVVADGPPDPAQTTEGALA